MGEGGTYSLCRRRFCEKAGWGSIQNCEGGHLIETLVIHDGRAGNDVSRRFGKAKGTFRGLSTLWVPYADVRRRKLLMHNSCVLSELLYSLDSLCLLRQDRQARCFPQQVSAPHLTVFKNVSRVRSTNVMAKAETKSLSAILCERHLQFYKTVASEADGSLVKRIM